MTRNDTDHPWTGSWGVKVVGFGLFLLWLRFGWQYTREHPGDNRWLWVFYWLGGFSLLLFLVRAYETVAKKRGAGSARRKDT